MNYNIFNIYYIYYICPYIIYNIKLSSVYRFNDDSSE